jgi:hypothetical protein
MCAALTDLTFDEWVNHVFDHPVDHLMPEWYRDIDGDYWHAQQKPNETVAYITWAFEQIEDIAKPYTDAQLNQGLWYIASNGLSDYMFALMDGRVPLEHRLSCVRSFYSLYANLFAPRCSKTLGHLQTTALPLTPDQNPLDSVCYMWWDLLPIGGPPNEPEFRALNETILDVMEKTLLLSCDLCREGALHGLGHWARYYTDRVQTIIDDFLAREPGLPAELKAYARAARGGCVL